MQSPVFRVVLTALFALSLALACGEESDDGDDGGGAEACPADAPANTSSCSDLDPGLSCTYGGTQCTCSGISWNCVQGGNTNTSGGPTGSGGNGFGPGPTG